MNTLTSLLTGAMRTLRYPVPLAVGLFVAAGVGVPAESGAQGLTPPLPFVALAPCRLVDTRGNGFGGAFGPPALASGVARDFPLAGQCGIPPEAEAVSLNVTAVNTLGPGFLMLGPAGGALATVSTLNYLGDQTVANAALAPLGPGGLTVVAGVSGTHLILDVNGYFVDAGLLALGDITAVTAGAGLTGGGTSGAVSLAVDTGAIQVRVTGSCPAGQYVRAIGATGQVTCGTDAGGTITGVTAGAGLSGGGAAGNVTVSLATPVAVASGGTGATTAAGARSNLGAGTITGVTVGAGLEGGGPSGDVTLGVAPTFRLPQGCPDGATTVASNGVWACASAGPRFVDNGDGTISDRQTGLMWEKKLAADGSQGGSCDLAQPSRSIHCANNTYLWSSALFGTAPDGALFTDFLARINTELSTSANASSVDVAGYHDWRVPNIAELRTILAACPGGGSPCIDPIFLPVASNYWSSSSVASNPAIAWGVNFGSGGVFGDFKNGGGGGNFVRAVRGGP